MPDIRRAGKKKKGGASKDWFCLFEKKRASIRDIERNRDREKT